MSIKLIIFDLDGTLVDSSGDIADAINHAVGPYNVPQVTVRETISLVGEGISRLMEKIIEKKGLNADRDFLSRRFLEYYSAHLVDKTTVYPGVKETMEKLNGYKKAVISNKRQALSANILDALGLSAYLDIIVGSDTTPERKPSPAPVRYVLATLDIKPESAVIVGDSNYDIEAGKAAGIRTVAVTYGYRPLDILRGADFIINRMDELLGILAKI
ncbi:MAG: HAD-IA family hydrolase [Nitrospirae bacterium]|nr:HAD-IA family hydrolase [Nitrospirota bacterium]MCL5236979.1 HAD-IA family hydrolase [Nitrospirota bacterium]